MLSGPVEFGRNVLSRSVAFRLVALSRGVPYRRVALSSLDMTWHVAVYRFVASCLVALFCLLDELGGETGPNKVMFRPVMSQCTVLFG